MNWSEVGNSQNDFTIVDSDKIIFDDNKYCSNPTKVVSKFTNIYIAFVWLSKNVINTFNLNEYTNLEIQYEFKRCVIF